MKQSKHVPTILGTVKEILKASSGLLSFAGTIAGYIWPDETTDSITSEPVSVIVLPTSTTYNLELNGILEAKYLIKTIEFTLPGSIMNQQVIDAGNISYYNCPLGLINVKNNQTVQRYNYEGLVKRHTYLNKIDYPNWYSWYDSTYTTSMSKFKLKQPVEIAFNSTNDFELVDVKVALVANTTSNIDIKWSYYTYTYYNYGAGLTSSQYRSDGINKIRLLNKAVYNTINETYDKPTNTTVTGRAESSLIIYDEILKGHYEITNYEPQNNLLEVQSAYMDPGCLQNFIFDGLPQNASVRLRMKAILKRKGTDETAVPYIIVQDFHVNDEMNTLSATASNYVGSAPSIISYKQTDKIFQSDFSTKALENITLGGEPYKKVAIENNVQVNVISEIDIDLLTGFEAKAGSTFTAEINSRGYNIACQSIATDQYSYNCNYNSSASRVDNSLNIENKVVSVYPNPFKDYFTINLKKYIDQHISLSVINQFNLEERKYNLKVQQDALSIDLHDLPSGLYLFKIQSNIDSEVIKIIKE